MQFIWFRLFNATEFDDLDLVSKEYTVNLDGVGEKKFLVTRGDLISILYDDVLLSLNMNDQNPFYFEGLAVFVNEVDDVFIGIEIVDEG